MRKLYQKAERNLGVIMKNSVLSGWKSIWENQEGNFTVESAVIVPLIVLITALLLVVTVKRYEASLVKTSEVNASYAGSVRNPTKVINNTDLVNDYIEKIKNYIEEDKK